MFTDVLSLLGALPHHNRLGVSIGPPPHPATTLDYFTSTSSRAQGLGALDDLKNVVDESREAMYISWPILVGHSLIDLSTLNVQRPSLVLTTVCCSCISNA